MPSQKTPGMLAAEEGRGPMEKWLPPMIDAHGLTWTAKTLRITRKTLRDWLLILGLSYQRRVVSTSAGRVDGGPDGPAGQ